MSKAKAKSKFVFAVDQAATSGWALVALDSKQRPCLFGSGIARIYTRNGHADAANAIARSMQLSLDHNARLCAVMESHKGGRETRSTVLGYGRARGYWEALLAAHGIRGKMVSHVSPATWRTIMPTGERNKDGALRRASGLRPGIADHNRAEAICIALWALYKGEEHE